MAGCLRPHREAKTLRPNWSVLWIYLLGVFMGALDTSVLAPAFPLLAHAFRISLGWDAWTVTTYTVAYVASTVLAGAAGDRWGRERLFSWGIVAFGAASLLAVASGTFWVFLLARAVQGAGAGAVYPNAQAAGIAEFPPERRGTALGIFGAAFGVATILGPNLGGLLAQYLTWRSIFLLNVPLALVVLLRARSLPSAARSSEPLPDWRGGVAFAAMLAAALLVIALPSWWRWPALGVAVLLAAAFGLRQRTAREPFLDTAPLANRAGVAMVVGAAIIGLDMSSAVFVPMLTQKDFGFSVLASGVALMPAALSGAVLAGVVGVLVDRIGPRILVQVGLLLAAVGGTLLALPHLNLTRFLLAMVALGTSTAFTMGAPLNRIALALYRDSRSAQALSLAAVFRSVGLAAGPVLLTAAARRTGLGGMFGVVAVASAVGVVVFYGVPQRVAAPVADRGQPVTES